VGQSFSNSRAADKIFPVSSLEDGAFVGTSSSSRKRSSFLLIVSDDSGGDDDDDDNVGMSDADADNMKDADDDDDDDDDDKNTEAKGHFSTSAEQLDPFICRLLNKVG